MDVVLGGNEMKQSFTRRVLGATAATLAVLALGSSPPASAADAPYDVLVFSRTAGFRHDAIPAGIQTIRELGTANGFSVTATEDPAAFSTAGLASYEAGAFLHHNRAGLTATQRAGDQPHSRAP